MRGIYVNSLHKYPQEHMAVGAAQSEEESEAMAKAFLAGELPVQDFLKAFIAKRVVGGLLFHNLSSK